LVCYEHAVEDINVWKDEEYTSKTYILILAATSCEFGEYKLVAEGKSIA